MDVLEMERDAATIRLTRKELTILANAINEMQEAIEDWEFATRVGAEPAEAEALRRQVVTLLDAIEEE